MDDSLRRELRTFYEAEGQVNYQSRLYDDRDWIHKRLKSLIIAELKECCAPKTKLLDAGCAEGLYLRVAQELGAIPTGVDLSFNKLVRGQSLQTPCSNVEFCLATLECLPWASAVFDTVLCVETLEHVPDYHRALAELHRVLKSSGMLIVSVPTEKNEFGGAYKTRLGWRQKSGHLHSFSRKSFVRALSNAGFAVHKELTVDVLGTRLRYVLVSNVLWKLSRAIWHSWRHLRRAETQSEVSELDKSPPSVTTGLWLTMDAILTRVPLVRCWSSMAVWVGQKID